MSGIFISYRRDDSAPWAGRLRDRLAADLGVDRVFFDIDSIDLGQDFRAVIDSTLTSCNVVLVLIGPSWLGREADGRRRIDDEADQHRVEVATALRSNRRVIPLLVGGAKMPTAEELPPDLKDLAFRNALVVEHDSFGRDIDVLERAVRRLDDAAAAPVEFVSPPTSSAKRSVVRPSVIAAVVIVAVAALAVWLSRDDRGAVTEASSAPVASTAFTLPDNGRVFGRPVVEVVALLESDGLVVRQDQIECSDSIEPGFVREVTVSRDLNKNIIFGKETDSFDTVAIASLGPGDELTVWTPLKHGC